jgi:hypothetical protein
LLSPEKKIKLITLLATKRLNISDIQTINHNIQEDIDNERKSLKQEEERLAKIFSKMPTKKERDEFRFSEMEFYSK